MQKPILPGSLMQDGRMPTLGVMGGGQLGRMFVQAAQRMGYFTAVLDPDPASPAGTISQYHIQTDYLDEQGLAQLLQRSAAITTEFENVPAPALVTLGAHRPVAPSAECVAIAQDRRLEKTRLAEIGRRSGVMPVPYVVIEKSIDIIGTPDDCLPGLLKTATLGYDGKGQVKVTTRAQATIAWKQLKSAPCVLEQRVALAAECSVIVARGADGQSVTLPVARNHHIDGILASTEVYEGNLPSAVIFSALFAAKTIADELEYVGVLCVEFFVLQDAKGGLSESSPLAVNEIAPRPHNSGHWSLDGSDVSQFDLQVRTLCGLPLAAPRQHSACVMLNLLGDAWFDANGVRELASEKAVSPPWDAVLQLPGTHLHLYGKLDARRGRKMGHLTVTGPTIASAQATASAAARLLGLVYAATAPAAAMTTGGADSA